jgi:hypothetical protein
VAEVDVNIFNILFGVWVSSEISAFGAVRTGVGPTQWNNASTSENWLPVHQSSALLELDKSLRIICTTTSSS